jgi:amino acid transporter
LTIVASPTSLAKRLLLGRPFRSDRLQHTLLPKRIALPVFASDALSSVAYAPDEILLTLSIAGAGAFIYSPWVTLAVAVVMVTVVASYRQNVHAYPSGGGDYEVATVNLGPRFGVAVASALLVDYILTVAVSVAAGVSNLGSVVPFVAEHKIGIALIAVTLLTAMNLRGLRESGTAFAIPTYAFIVVIVGMILTGLVRVFVLGQDLQAPSANLKIDAEEHHLTSFAMVFLLLRTFSSGCAALTGVEAISNGVPAFRKPKSRNAATTLLLLGMIAITMIISVVVLANRMNVRYVDPADLDRLRTADGAPVPASYDQHTVIAQIARAVFDGFPPGFYFVVSVTGIILVLAANTAFNGFPVLASILAKDGHLPRQLSSRGDRLAYSNGILILAFMAVALIIAFDAEVTRLIQLYIVGVFVSFNLSQLGMIRHWTRHLKDETDPAARRRMYRSRAINAFGLGMTAVVLVIVLLTKFVAGAWIAILAMGVFFVIMRAIRKHYDDVSQELTVEADDQVLPTRVHSIVLVSKVHKPTMRALAYAKASRPNLLEAVLVDADSASTARILEEWDERRIDVPLKVLYSPYREIIRPIVEYVRSVRDANPRGLVAVYIPEYVVGHWWEQVLHNQTALRLKTRLLFTGGVMVTSVPYQLRSSVVAKQRAERSVNQVRAGDVRRGQVRRSSDRDRTGNLR